MRKGPGKRGHIVAHDVSWAAQTGKHLLRTQNVSEQNQKHFCAPDTKFVSPTNVAHYEAVFISKILFPVFVIRYHEFVIH